MCQTKTSYLLTLLDLKCVRQTRKYVATSLNWSENNRWPTIIFIPVKLLTIIVTIIQVKNMVYRIAGKLGGKKIWQEESLARKSLANWLFSSIWRKKVWRITRSAHRLSIVSTKLDGFSLANNERFAKLSIRQTFPLYGTTV